jgi:hypothetical protein
MTSAAAAPVESILESVTLFLQNIPPGHAKMAGAAGVAAASLFVCCSVGSKFKEIQKKKVKRKVGPKKAKPNGNSVRKSVTGTHTQARKKFAPSKDKSPLARQAGRAAKKRSPKAEQVPDSHEYGLLSTGLAHCGFSEYVELFTKTGRPTCTGLGLAACTLRLARAVC